MTICVCIASLPCLGMTPASTQEELLSQSWLNGGHPFGSYCPTSGYAVTVSGHSRCQCQQSCCWKLALLACQSTVVADWCLTEYAMQQAGMKATTAGWAVGSSGREQRIPQLLWDAATSVGDVLAQSLSLDFLRPLGTHGGLRTRKETRRRGLPDTFERKATGTLRMQARCETLMSDSGVKGWTTAKRLRVMQSSGKVALNRCGHPVLLAKQTWNERFRGRDLADYADSVCRIPSELNPARGLWRGGWTAGLHRTCARPFVVAVVHASQIF
eukprot:6474887-Amphidinium_carterae.1